MMRNLAMLACMLAIGCGGGGGDPDAGAPDADIETPEERGLYIVNNVGVCNFCHTPLNEDGTRDLTRLLAGWDCFADIDPVTDNFGCVSSRNLTNHETGLANATDQQIRDALTMGMRTDGKTLTPIMPYWIFHNMTSDDIDAVIAYLRTVPGVDHTVAVNEEPWFSMNENGPAAQGIDAADIPAPETSDPNYDSAMNGRYLTSMAGLCIDCHTPRTMPPEPVPVDMTMPFAGGNMFPAQELGLLVPPYPAIVTTRNLTPHATGLEGFTAEDIMEAISEGRDQDGNAVCAGTHGNGISPYAGLTDQDLADIANYILTLAPIDNDTGENCAGPPVP